MPVTREAQSDCQERTTFIARTAVCESAKSATCWPADEAEDPLVPDSRLRSRTPVAPIESRSNFWHSPNGSEPASPVDFSAHGEISLSWGNSVAVSSSAPGPVGAEVSVGVGLALSVTVTVAVGEGDALGSDEVVPPWPVGSSSRVTEHPERATPRATRATVPLLTLIAEAVRRHVGSVLPPRPTSVPGRVWSACPDTLRLPPRRGRSMVPVARGERMSRRESRTTLRSRLIVGLLFSAVLVAGCAAEDPQPAPTPSQSPSAPATLQFAVYGAEEVVAAYTQVAENFSGTHPETEIEVQSYDTHDEAIEAMAEAREQGAGPDVFLIDQGDLGGLTKDEAVRRIDNLLAERRVDFGDGYARKGLEAFSADAALQCMPVNVSPLVVYYNTDLIDLATVAAPGSNPVDQENGWSLEEFRAAALQARSRGVRGAYIAPDLEQVAPFVWSGGGDIVDDPLAATTLTLSEGSSQAAMEKLLELVRDPALTFNQQALAKRSALERFESGSLAMILGFRNLTPQLRAQKNLAFDVMPMPKVSSSATTATMTGLCLSADSAHEGLAADFIADVVSEAGLETLAQTGYVVPANLDVANSEAFAQPDQRPAHPEVFVNAFRSSRPLPESEAWPTVRAQSMRLLTDLFYQPVILPLDERLKEIDAASMLLFDPTGTPAGLPTASPSATP